jgi:hypothetical protein
MSGYAPSPHWHGHRVIASCSTASKAASQIPSRREREAARPSAGSRIAPLRNDSAALQQCQGSQPPVGGDVVWRAQLIVGSQRPMLEHVSKSAQHLVFGHPPRDDPLTRTGSSATAFFRSRSVLRSVTPANRAATASAVEASLARSHASAVAIVSSAILMP